MTAEVVLALIGLALQYGVPTIQVALVAWNKPIITIEDVDGLKLLIKLPSEY